MARLDAKDRRQVGTLLHSCGQVAPVFQNKRLHLYLHCPQCGHLQDNTAATQTAIYRGMTKGETAFPPPRNLLQEAAPVVPAAPEIDRKPPATTETAGGNTEPKPAPETEKKPVQSSGGLGLLLIFCGLLGAGVAVLR